MSLQRRTRYETNQGTCLCQVICVFFFFTGSLKSKNKTLLNTQEIEFSQEICHIFPGYGIGEHSKKTNQILDYSHQVQSTSSYCLSFCALNFGPKASSPVSNFQLLNIHKAHSVCFLMLSKTRSKKIAQYNLFNVLNLGTRGSKNVN